MLRGFEYGLLIFLVAAILLGYRQGILILDEIVSFGRFFVRIAIGLAIGVAVPTCLLELMRRTLLHHMSR